MLISSVICDDDGNTESVVLRPASSAHHLKDVHNTVLLKTLLSVLKCRLDNDQMCWQVHSGSQGAGTAERFDLSFTEQSFNQTPITDTKTSVMIRIARSNTLYTKLLRTTDARDCTLKFSVFKASSA